MCNDVQQEGAKPSPDLAYELFCYGLLHNIRYGIQVRQWATQGFMVGLLNLLLQNHFDVFITSDHGNIEARGCGQISEGAIVDLRGVRARVYSDKVLRAQVQKRFPGAIDWPPFGLPENFLPLLAPNRSAFIPEGKRVVGHGGISIEELIVPYVQVRRETT